MKDPDLEDIRIGLQQFLENATVEVSHAAIWPGFKVLMYRQDPKKEGRIQALKHFISYDSARALLGEQGEGRFVGHEAKRTDW